MSLFNSTAYLTPDQASDYFIGRTVSDAWDSATDDQQTKSLLDATRRIDRLNFAGLRTSDHNRRTAALGVDGVLIGSNVLLPTDPGQPLEFPRDGATQIPEEVLAACCEIAYALLDGIDPEMESQGLGVTSQGFAALRESYDTQVGRLAFRHGIPSYTAWNYLYPFLADPTELVLRRTS